MEEQRVSEAPQRVDGKITLTEVVRKLQETCGNCKPLTAIMCLTSCNVWRLKNQLRNAHERMKNPNYMRNLLNALKNGRRLKILAVTAEERAGIERLQYRLREEGYNHSRETVTKEYMVPMVDAGLIEENQDHYRATILGRKISELTGNFRNFGELFPPHSECYEETSLNALLETSRTFDGFEGIMPPKSVARVLKRLEQANFVETKEENDYIFYFKTKRDRRESKLSPTEEKIYENIPDEGIPARKIASAARISLRRTYKYLRKLRGKKLVFTRRIPKVYKLTDRGVEVAVMLKRMHNLAIETLAATTRLLEDEEKGELPPDTRGIKRNREERENIPLTALRMAESN